MIPTRVARAAIDWARIQSKLGLSKETIVSLQTFRKRADDARRQTVQLREAKTEVDFARYRDILKNKEIVAEAEKLLGSFKPDDYDVGAQLKAIDAFQSKAIESAKAAAIKIEAELKDLESTLKNIEDARPFEDLTIDDVVKARPEISQAVEEAIKQGKWSVPGYQEKFGNISAL